MNRLNEFLQSLDRRNLIMLYLSVLILFFIIGYFVYQNILLPKEKTLVNKKITLIKKIRKAKKNSKDTILLKREIKSEKLRLNGAREDLNYLKTLIFSSKKLNISEKEYLNILNKYILVGSNLNASFKFNKTDNLNKYNILIKGKFLPDKYFLFLEFLKTLQAQEPIITINSLNVDNNESVIYDINLSIWGF